MASALNTASALTITELTGEKRQLRLVGRALPYQGVAFPGEQRVEITWYPGNPEATAQVLGAREGDTVLTGKWKDRFLADLIAVEDDGSPIVGPSVISPATLIKQGSQDRLQTAAAVVKAVTDIRRKGQYIELAWGEEVRRGYMTRFSPKYDRVQDVEWEMTFQWTSLGDTAGPPVFQIQADISKVSGDWSSSLRGLLTAATATFAPVDSFNELVDTQLAKVATSVNSVFDTASRLTESLIEPLDAARRLTGIYSSIKSQAQDLADKATSTTEWELTKIGNAFSANATPEDLGQFPQGLGVLPANVAAERIAPGGSTPDVGFGQVVANVLYQRGLRATARDMGYQAANARAETIRKIEPLLLGIFTARDGGDLRDISTLFYQTPDQWRTLADFNGLETSKLTAGTVVFVPQLRQQGHGIQV